MTRPRGFLPLLALAPVLACGAPEEDDAAPNYTWEVMPEGRATDVAMRADGDVVVTGTRDGDFWLARFDSETGEEIWSTTQDWAGGADIAASVAVSGDAIHVVGTAWTGGEGSSTCEDPEGCPQYHGIWIAEFDSEGELVWDEVHATSSVNEDEGTAVALASDGHPIVAGRLVAGADGGAWIRRYGPDATIVWETTIPSYSSATDIAVTAQDEVYVADGRQRRLHMLDADGVLSWSVDLEDQAYLVGIALLPGGGLAGIDASGEIYGIAADGAIEWVIVPDLDVNGSGIAVDADGAIAAVGSIGSSELHDHRQIWARGADANGQLTWSIQHRVGAEPDGDALDRDGVAAATFVPGGDLVMVGSVFVGDVAYAWLARTSVPPS